MQTTEQKKSYVAPHELQNGDTVLINGQFAVVMFTIPCLDKRTVIHFDVLNPITYGFSDVLIKMHL